tara:strand:- start:5294 stop:5890 length:597 start_codon:yes stop_codon:yes gene_type:complete
MATFNQRNITDFRARMTGGGARSNLFEVEITFPGGLAISESLVSDKVPFLVKAAEIPASNLGNIPVPYRGRVLPIAGDRTFDPWTVTVINDTDFSIRDAMERWSNSINDIQTAQGTINPEDYQTSARVFQKSREGIGPGDTEKDLRIYKFEGIYPNVVSSIPLDFGATDQIEEFQVTFNYLYWETEQTDQPTGTLPLN